MRINNPNRISTRTIATYIANSLDIPFTEVIEILRMEHQVTRDTIIEKDISIAYDNLITFAPIRTYQGYRTYRITLSRYILRDLIKHKIYEDNYGKEK